MNKKIKLSVGIMLGIFTLFGFFASATPASAMTCNSATLHGTVNVANTPTWAHFVYSTDYNTVSSNGGTATASQSFYNKGSFPISQGISNLAENTTYHFRLIGSDNNGPFPPASIQSFTTPNCQTQTYTVTAIAGAGGNISPSSRLVNSGQTTTFTVTPNSGYTINSTSGCNGNLNGNTYTTGAITANCTVNASFNPVQNQTYTVSTNAGTGGYFNPTSRQVDSGQTTTFSVYANSGYTINSTSGCNGNLNGNTYTTGAITANCTVNASFSPVQNQNPTVNLTANPSTIQSGQYSTLTWTSTNASSCIPSWSFYGTATSGSDRVYPTSTTTYSVSCTGINGGSAYDTAVVNVNYVNQTCQDTSANNYGGTAPCTYNAQVCLSAGAINYGGPLPCRYQQAIQPTVVLYSDQASLAYSGATTIRWSTANATSCFASGGSAGWAGTKSIGPGSFYTGSLTASRVYSITCSNNVGSASDSTTVNVRPLVINNPRPTATSLVLISSTVDRNQPIVPTIDNTRPHPGDEINYTVNYQNIGTGAITGLTLRMDLPYEVDYMFSNPSNPTRNGNTLIFNLGTLRANGSGTVTVRVKVRENIPNGTNLNFPATLSYIDPSGFPQSVSANVSAQVLTEQVVIPATVTTVVPLGANVFGAGFLPANLFGWLLLLILVLALALLAKYLFGSPFSRQTTTTSNQLGGAKKTTTTTIQ